MRNFVLTSMSLTEGHPDKLCDRISDAIVDAYLTRDVDARLTAECAVASGIVFIGAHVASTATVDLSLVARELIAETGYADPDFNPEKVTILSSLTPHRQPAVAGTRASQIESMNTTVFGYACRHTPEMMPMSIALAHRLARRLSQVRREDERLKMLHPDGQIQVAVRYRDRKPERLEAVMLYTALERASPRARIAEEDVKRAVIYPVLSDIDLPSSDASITVLLGEGEPSGGPAWHGGLTGRKNHVDCYGGYCRHGGAALSGKDASRIDRLGAYAARYAAKTLVASGLAEECEVQLSYTMSQLHPLSVEIDTYGTGKESDHVVSRALCEALDFRPGALSERFNLSHLPSERGGRFFQDLAVFGHFGRMDLDPPWEREDLVADLLQRLA